MRTLDRVPSRLNSPSPCPLPHPMVARVCHGCRSNTHAASDIYTLATIGWGRGQGEGGFLFLLNLPRSLDPSHDNCPRQTHVEGVWLWHEHCQ